LENFGFTHIHHLIEKNEDAIINEDEGEEELGDEEEEDEEEEDIYTSLDQGALT